MYGVQIGSDIDSDDSDFKEKHRNWVKDKSGFDHVELFMKIIDARKDRESIIQEHGGFVSTKKAAAVEGEEEDLRALSKFKENDIMNDE